MIHLTSRRVPAVKEYFTLEDLLHKPRILRRSLTSRGLVWSSRSHYVDIAFSGISKGEGYVPAVENREGEATSRRKACDISYCCGPRQVNQALANRDRSETFELGYLGI